MRVVVGSPTIKAGQAVAFITQSNMGPTVTEGSDGIAVEGACVDVGLAARVPMVVTFYKPGTYNIFCRKAPTIMLTVVTVL